MKFPAAILFFCFSSIFISGDLFAQVNAVEYQEDLNLYDSIKKNTPYIRAAIRYLDEDEYQLSILELENGIEKAFLRADTLQLLGAYTVVGNNFMQLGLFDQALDNYTKGLLMSYKLESPAYEARYANSMGYYFYAIGDYLKAEKYYTIALNIREKYNDRKGLCQSYHNIALIHQTNENYEKALSYYFKSLKLLELEKKDTSEYILRLNNIGSVYRQLNQYDKGREYLQLGYQLSVDVGSKSKQSLTLHNIGDSYLSENDYENAILNLLESYQIAESIQAHDLMMASSESLSDAYEEMGEYEKMVVFLRKNFELKEAELELKLDKQYASMQTTFELVEKNKEIALLENNKKLDEQKRNTLIVSVVLLLFFGFLIVNRQRKLIKKDKLLLELEIGEKNRLEEELTYKTHELTNYALHIAQRNDFIRKIKAELLKLTRTAIDVSVNTEIKNVIIKLNQFSNNNKDLEEFNKKLEDVSRHFLERLNKEFVDLTEKERQLCIYLRLEFSSKEIASITNISAKSVDMGRYRLRKKLGLGKDVNFYEYLRQI